MKHRITERLNLYEVVYEPVIDEKPERKTERMIFQSITELDQYYEELQATVISVKLVTDNPEDIYGVFTLLYADIKPPDFPFNCWAKAHSITGRIMEEIKASKARVSKDCLVKLKDEIHSQVNAALVEEENNYKKLNK